MNVIKGMNITPKLDYAFNNVLGVTWCEWPDLSLG